MNKREQTWTVAYGPVYVYLFPSAIVNSSFLCPQCLHLRRSVLLCGAMVLAVEDVRHLLFSLRETADFVLYALTQSISREFLQIHLRPLVRRCPCRPVPLS